VKIRLSTFLALLLIPLAWTSARAQNPSATVIGNDTYTTLSNLPGVVGDNTLTVNALKACGYTVTLTRNRTSAEMSGDVISSVPQVPNDFWLFKYSGHGDNYAGSQSGSMLGINSDGASPPSDRYTPGLFVADMSVPAPFTRVIILDSCGSGAFIQTANTAALVANIEAVWFSATSTGAECAYDRPDNSSGWFTSIFMNGLSGAADGCGGNPADGVITADEMDCYLTANYDNKVTQDPNLVHRYIANGLGGTALCHFRPVAVQARTWGSVKAIYR
jgi:hypothetical protein